MEVEDLHEALRVVARRRIHRDPSNPRPRRVAMRFAIVLVKEDAKWEALTEAERNFDAVVRWWTDLRARR